MKEYLLRSLIPGLICGVFVIFAGGPEWAALATALIVAFQEKSGTRDLKCEVKRLAWLLDNSERGKARM